MDCARARARVRVRLSEGFGLWAAGLQDTVGVRHVRGGGKKICQGKRALLRQVASTGLFSSHIGMLPKNANVNAPLAVKSV